MRKILSILLALGLVLSMAVAATPTAAQVTGTVPLGCSTLTFSPNNCAGQTAVTYVFNFTSPKVMFGGQDAFMVEFPEGTTIGTFILGDVTVEGVDVPLANISRPAANIIRIVPPVGQDYGVGAPVVICIGKITNPAVGSYTINLWHDRDCCVAEAFCAITYTIVPRYSSYKFEIDFSPTYPGIAPGFIPPFKACGQPGYGANLTDVGWANNATLTFKPDVLGCLAPCVNATMVIHPTKIPVGETLTVVFNSTEYVFENHPTDVTRQDVCTPVALDPIIGLEASTVITWELLIHADSPGDYEFCFEVVCPIPIDCSDDDKVTWDFCIPFKVYQDKEAWPIDLHQKWNLISLPLVPFDTSIESILAPISAPTQLKSVWYYDRGVDDWFAYGNGQTSLTDIEDGKGYWFRMLKAGETGYSAAAFPVTLWVFGTHRPMPPAGPPSYPVYDGPNMVGFLPIWDLAAVPAAPQTATDQEYLWNFWSVALTFPDYGTIYSWNPLLGTAGNWVMQMPGSATLWPTQGYWIVFDRDGTINP